MSTGMNLIPVEFILPIRVPPSKYLRTCEAFLSGDNKTMLVDAPEISPNALYFGFRRIIREKQFPIRVSRRADKIYLEKT